LALALNDLLYGFSLVLAHSLNIEQYLNAGPKLFSKLFMYRIFGKRLLDLGLVLGVLILLWPILALVALLVRLKLGSPILFRQQRPGQYGQPFTLYKFRTMTDARDAQGALLPDAQRLTPFGQFLRSTSLDELPELINILKGEMSLVGPRPLLMKYLDRYTPAQMRRHEAPPGITGYAQINGRNVLTWEQKFALDVWYVDHQSFWLDLKIIFLTLWKILTREGINQPGKATMEEFKGYPTK
jgi:sugar transferase EpsL